MASSVAVVQIEGKSLKLSNLEKVLYPSPAMTKAGVIDYYRLLILCGLANVPRFQRL